MSEEKKKFDLQELTKWGLNFATTVALGVGAWFFSGINVNVARLTDAVNDLKTQVAVLKKEDEKIETLQKEIVSIRTEQVKRTENIYKVQTLEERVKMLELYINMNLKDK